MSGGIRLLPDREAECERRPQPERAGDPYLAAVQLDELPAQGKPEPGALLLRGAGSDLTKFLEDRLVILRRDADAGVADRQVDRPVLGYRLHLDPAPFRRELDRIRQQVQQHLPDLALVSAHLTDAVVDGGPERDAAPSGPLADEGQRAVDRRGKAEVRQLQ